MGPLGISGGQLSQCAERHRVSFGGNAILAPLVPFAGVASARSAIGFGRTEPFGLARGCQGQRHQTPRVLPPAMGQTSNELRELMRQNLFVGRPNIVDKVVILLTVTRQIHGTVELFFE